MMLGGKGIGLGLRGQVSNAISLPAGDTYVIPPGNFVVGLGAYTSLQFLDPVTGIWRNIGASNGSVPKFIASDGNNYRLANLTGCPVAATIVTGSATGATTGIGTTATALTVTPSSGSSTWCPIVGGAVALLAVTGGVTGLGPNTGYLFNPTILISAPPVGGLQATAHATLTGGSLTLNSIIIDNQGAGYVQAPTITVVNDPRDTSGAYIMPIKLGLTGTGTLTGLYPLTQGAPLTGVPTLAFSTGIGSAIAVMNFTVTAFVTVAQMTGAAWMTGTTPVLISVGNLAATTSSMTNPLHQGAGATFPRPARIVTALAANVIVTTGSVIEDGGFGIQVIPTAQYIGSLGSIVTGITGGPPPTLTVGGVTDTSFLQPI